MRHPTPPTPPSRRGFTIMEMILSLAVSSIVLLGVASLLSLSTRAVPPPDGVQEVSVQAADLLARLETDLSTATRVTEATATALTLVVPDRDGDSAEETIRYAWSGVASEPVLRTLNAGTPAEMLSGTTGFAITYAWQLATVYPAQSRVVGAASVLQTSTASAALTKKLTGLSLGQVFEPTLPATALAWTLDEIVLKPRQSGKLDTTLLCEIRGCDAALNPTGAVYTSFTIREQDMPTVALSWRQSIPGVTVPAGTKLCIVISVVAGDGNVELGVSKPAGWPATAPELCSKDGGVTWTQDTKEVLDHEAVGRVIESVGGAESRSALRSVGIRIEAGSQAWSTTLETQPLNPADVTTVAAAIVEAG